jgi:hypothetical protein
MPDRYETARRISGWRENELWRMLERVKTEIFQTDPLPVSSGIFIHGGE